MQQILLFKLPITLCPTREHFLEQLKKALLNKRPLTVSFVNPYAWRVRRQYPAYERDLGRLDVVLADGIGVVGVLHWLSGVRIARLSFDDTSLYRPFMATLCQHQKSLFIIGGVPGVAESAAERIRKDFPTLDLRASLSGFEDHKSAIAQILASHADAVLCGMGLPQQERLIVELKEAGFEGVAISCGGFLDQLIRAETYYPKIIDQLELRWLYRLAREPRRLAKRYLVHYWAFIRAVLARLPERLAKGPLSLPTVIRYSPQDGPTE